MSLISCHAVFDQLGNPDLVILDASMPPVGISLPEVKMPCYIPGARRFDINALSDASSELPHMLLSPAAFQEKARALGINQHTKIIIYDNVGIYSSPRAWWNFKVMGVDNVYVLDGGLPAWVEQGLDTVTTPGKAIVGGDLSVNFQFSKVIESAGIIDAMEKQSITIIDLRSRERFNGEVDEPRPGLRRGHIPGSYNLPFTDLYNGEFFKTQEEIELMFRKNASGKDEQLVFSCGSGVTACIGILAASICGYTHLTLYDGSWADWASNLVLPSE
ncbi:3-mercaptopyruvate sulfurtransferase [Thalassocella blandensis]|nr:3-mercaptopyruvate sulfurtransferase [Thalassocella blandensis]